MHRAIALLFLLTPSLHAGDDGYKPMFNGKDLSGWVNVNCAPGTFFVKDDMVITTGKPTGYLRTDRQYENFIAEFDWMHAPKPKGSVGNSGFFVWADPIPAVGTGYTRGIEVQVLVNLEKKNAYTSQGDLFSIWGAKCKPDRPHPMGWERCLPSENRTKGEFEWNHYKVIGNNGVLKLEVNGKEVSGVSECNPRKGYLALESEGSECRFKNLKIKELPSTNPKPNEIADVDKGFKCMFTGLNLAGWKTRDKESGWKMGDGVLRSDGKSGILYTEKSYQNVELVCDFNGGKTVVYVQTRAIRLDAKKMGWTRAFIRVEEGKPIAIQVDGVATMQSPDAGPVIAPIGLDLFDGASVRNVFMRELK